MAYISPQIKIELYQPKNPSPITIEKGIKSISSTRNISGEGSVQLGFSEPGNVPILINGVGVGFKPIQELFKLNTIIIIYTKRNSSEQWRQLNIAYVDASTQKLSAAGSYDISYTFPTLEKKFQEAELFIDYKKTDANSTAENPVQKQTIELALQNVTSTFSEYKTLPTIIKAIWDTLLVNLMQVQLISDPNPNYSGQFSFGGKFWLGKTSDTNNSAILLPEILPLGLTTTLIQVFEITSQFNFGENINFWQIITSMMSEPFYEWFLDPLETTPDDEGIIDVLNTYQVDSGSCKFVFRQTPFDSLFPSQKKWDLSNSEYHKIKLTDLKNLTYQVSNNEIYSGVHVGLTVLDQANLLIAPVKWNNVIRALTGIPRVLQVKLSGLGFETGANQAQISGYTKNLEFLRDKLYNIFFNPSDLKIGRGSLNLHFDYYRVGKPFKLDEPIGHGEIDFFQFGYITSVTDTLDANGAASSQINFKWSPVNLFEI